MMIKMKKMTMMVILVMMMINVKMMMMIECQMCQLKNFPTTMQISRTQLEAVIN